MNKIAKFRAKEYPDCWLVTDFTMDQIERLIEHYEKIIVDLRKTSQSSFGIDSIRLDQDRQRSCNLCIHFEEHNEKPKGSIGGCNYINDWLYTEATAITCFGYKKKDTD